MVANKLLLENLIESCPDGVIGVDRTGIIFVFNRAAEVLTGMLAKETVGKKSIIDVYNPPELARKIKKLLYSPGYGGVGRLDGFEVVVRGSGGRDVPIRLSAALLFEDGIEVGSVGFFHDLTERKLMEEELRLRAITDSLTNMYNRRHFHTILSQEANRSARYNRPLSLCMIDLDHFKPFNDTYGHAEGDAILCLCSQVTQANMRNVDTAFRIGGDEFAILMVETGLEQAHISMERLRRDFNQRWPAKMSYLGGHLRPVTMSMGLAQLVHGEKPDKLIMRADLAMYEAKKEGGDCAVKAREAIKVD
jgi:diguanylate cyclase (GGDEF)-like protein/PAS domain S-box-containing protein